MRCQEVCWEVKEACRFIIYFSEIKKNTKQEPIKREWWDYKRKLFCDIPDERLAEKMQADEDNDELEYRRRRKNNKKFKR